GGPRLAGPGPTAPRSGRPTLPQPPTALTRTPHGVPLETLTTGTGDPVTVFAHGLGNSIAETRPLASGVTGRRVFLHLRGHGRSGAPPGPWTYADLARDLRAVADLTGATRALGVSLGAGALTRLLADSPRRFTHAVFFLPAVLDRPRGPAARARLAALLEAVASGEAALIAEAAAADIPAQVRHTPAGWAYLRQRVAQLSGQGLAPALAGLPEDVAVPDRAALDQVTARCLVIGAQGDEVHPARVAEELAESLPHAQLHVYDRPGVLWTARADLRTRISAFLNDA
ncbi:MAG TPA: alpha/beta hydrolase, partial [Pilimelia sp.]|nr:alpha/beta hydrolase [Pilimelia sp.]